MNRITELIKRFMAGRYGGDQLSIALFLLSVVLNFGLQFTGIPYLLIIGYIPLAFCIYRMMSKNTRQRSLENYKFNILLSPVYALLKKTQRRALESKTHKFMKCPHCKAELRLPKNKGKIMVTCPQCKTEFISKS